MTASKKWFQPGDEVIRTKCTFREAILGRTYIVKTDDSYGVRLVGCTGAYSRDAFELTKPRPKTAKELADDFRKANAELFEARKALLDLGYKGYFRKPGATGGFHPTGTVASHTPNDYEFRKEVITTDVV